MSRIIVALDLPSESEARRVAAAVAPSVAGFKAGIGLLYLHGPGIIGELADLGRPVFADVKLHDIPSQVASAAGRLASHGARWVTAHASGGRSMLEAAVGAFGRGVLAVTVLTSLDRGSLAEAGLAGPPEQMVIAMTQLAAEAGCEGVICSPQELEIVTAAAPDLVRVTPGIRPAGATLDDQTRIATPAEAVRRGATYLVVGRPIVASSDPGASAAAMAADADTT